TRIYSLHETTGGTMNDDAHASLAGFLAHPEEPQPDLPDPATRPPGQLSSSQAIWLVLAAHLRGLEVAGVIDERSTTTLAGALERAAEVPASERSFRRLAQSLEARVDSGLQD